MIQSTNETIQILPTNTSDIIFSNDELRTRSATCSGWLNHTEGTSQYTILGSGNCSQPSVYRITFNANVSGETDKSFHYMIKSLEDFIKVLNEEAETPQQKQKLRETLQRSMM